MNPHTQTRETIEGLLGDCRLEISETIAGMSELQMEADTLEAVLSEPHPSLTSMGLTPLT